MPKLTRKSIMTINHLSICYNTTSNSGSKRNHNEIAHAFCSTVHHFSNCCRVCIVGEGNRHIKFVLHEFGNWNDAWPREVGCIFNCSSVVVAVGGAHSNTTEPANSTSLFYKYRKVGVKVVDERLNIIVLLG